MSRSAEAKKYKRIMLVEDDPSFLKVMSMMFRDWGFQVIPCRDGFEALDALRHIRPDLVISDLDLPFISGIELFRRIQEMDGESSIPFFIISAIPDAEERLKSIRHELVGFHRKPVSVDTLKRIAFGLSENGDR